MSVICVFTFYLEDCPDIKRLQEIMRIEDIDIITRWHELGLVLVDSYRILKVIEADHRSDVNTCFHLMFKKWLDKTPNASWGQLVTALNNVEMNTAADAISKHFKSGMYNCRYAV